MDSGQLAKIKEVIASHPEIKLAYLFGSQATGNVGPMSDYDFAFHLEGLDSKERFTMKINLITALSSALKTDAIDVVILNDLDMPELAYDIIKNSIVLYEQEPYKVIIEPKILNQYFDFHTMLKQHGLTRVP